MNPIHDYDDELFLMEMELDELIECNNKSCNETDEDLIDTDDLDGIDGDDIDECDLLDD